MWRTIKAKINARCRVERFNSAMKQEKVSSDQTPMNVKQFIVIFKPTFRTVRLSYTALRVANTNY